MNRFAHPASILGSVVMIALLVVAATGAGREDTIATPRFGLLIDGELAGYFASVVDIGSMHDVAEHPVTNPQTGETTIQKIPGKWTFLDISLQRRLTPDDFLWDWRQLVLDGKIDEARADCSIIAYDRTGLEFARWDLEAAWPSHLSTPTPGPANDGHLFETVTLVHEGLTRAY